MTPVGWLQILLVLALVLVAAVPLGAFMSRSLSGDVSPAFAELQVARIAAARGVPADAVRRAIAQNTAGRTFGILGEPRVNVLGVNLALDAAAPQAPSAPVAAN